MLEAGEGETVAFDTLEVGANGAISVILDGETDTSSSFDVGSATFADGSYLYARVTSLADAEGTYAVLTADTLTGLPDLDLSAGYALPLLYTGTLEADANSLVLAVHRRTAAELELTTPQEEAFGAIMDQAGAYSLLEASLLQAEDLDTLVGQFDGLLPGYSGGVFDFVTRGSRLAARHLMDSDTIYDVSPVGAWIEPLYFRGSKDAGNTAGFKTSGNGVSGGMERDFGFGYLGFGLDYIGGSVANGDLQDIGSQMIEVSGHWRMRSGPFQAFARISGIHAQLSSTRAFSGTVDDTDFSYETTGDWDGWALSAMAGTRYDFELDRSLSLHPSVAVDYFWLKENGYEEDGADIIDLTVDGRTSKALAATTSLTVSYRLGRKTPDVTPLTIELEGGWRTVLDSGFGTTSAAFIDGESFSLTPDAVKGGWMSEVRILTGGFDFTWQLAAGAEQTQGDIDLNLRAGAQRGVLTVDQRRFALD